MWPRAFLTRTQKESIFWDEATSVHEPGGGKNTHTASARATRRITRTRGPFRRPRFLVVEQPRSSSHGCLTARALPDAETTAPRRRRERQLSGYPLSHRLLPLRPQELSWSYALLPCGDTHRD